MLRPTLTHPAGQTDNEVLVAHRGGEIHRSSRIPLNDVGQLAVVYAPGVAAVCIKIANFPERGHELPWKGNTIVVATGGSAVLELGDLGPEAALPVMEGDERFVPLVAPAVASQAKREGVCL